MGPWEALGGNEYVYEKGALSAELRREGARYRWVVRQWLSDLLGSYWYPTRASRTFGTARKARRMADLEVASRLLRQASL